MLEKEDQFREKAEKIEVDGVFVNKNYLLENITENAQYVILFSFSIHDDVYMLKYECCKSCYIRWVEDREERWESGWRPATGETKCQQNH